MVPLRRPALGLGSALAQRARSEEAAHGLELGGYASPERARLVRSTNARSRQFGRHRDVLLHPAIPRYPRAPHESTARTRRIRRLLRARRAQVQLNGLAALAG